MVWRSLKALIERYMVYWPACLVYTVLAFYPVSKTRFQRVYEVGCGYQVWLMSSVPTHHTPIIHTQRLWQQNKHWHWHILSNVKWNIP